MRQLDLMAHGVRRKDRAIAVAQAALVWGLGEIDVATFIETGKLEKATDTNLDFDPTLRSAIVKEFQGKV